MSFGRDLWEIDYGFNLLIAPISCNVLICQAADRNEYLERSLFRQNGARLIFHKTVVSAKFRKANHNITSMIPKRHLGRKTDHNELFYTAEIFKSDENEILK